MSPQAIRHVVTIALGIGAAFALTRQCRKPAGWLGRLVVRNMNARHSRVTDWGLGHVRIEKAFTILDVGCGGGRTIRKMAAMASEGKVFGIDYSPASIEVARKTNSGEIAKGRVDVREGTASQLPFPDGTFDLATAVETHYYWPRLREDVAEVRRVLKPGGRFAIIAETYKGSRLDAVFEPAMRMLGAAYLTADEHRDLLASAGFSEIEVSVKESRGWICAVGVNGSGGSAG